MILSKKEKETKIRQAVMLVQLASEKLKKASPDWADDLEQTAHSILLEELGENSYDN